MLNQLLCNDSDAIWKKEHQDAWDALVKAVVENVGIHHPNYTIILSMCARMAARWVSVIMKVLSGFGK